MSDKKSRPESHQKKADPEDGKISTDLKRKNEGDIDKERSSLSIDKKKSNVDRKKSATRISTSRLSGVERDKSALSLERQKSSTGRRKSATRLSGGLERDKSALSLERQKSATGRKKSATRLSQNSKNVRKFIGKIKPDKGFADDEDDDDRHQRTKLCDGKIWDDNIEKLALRKKRVSLMDQEIGLKQIRVIPPTPTIQNVGVKRAIRNKGDSKVAMVMKPAVSNAELIQPMYKGPRYDQLGQIIPHSILGDVDTFLKLSGQAAKVSNILLVHTSQPQAIRGGKCGHLQTSRGSKSVEENTAICNPSVNQKHALSTWKNEMEMRSKEQNRLAGLLKCDETSLLMCKSETKADRELVNILQFGDWRYHPDVCFWKLPQKCTAGHLQETLSKSSRGQLPTPVLSGDADTVLHEKSKVQEADLCKRFNNDSAKERIDTVKGTIQIANKVLFDKLLLQGEPVKSSDEIVGDYLAQQRGVRFFMGNVGCESDEFTKESADQVDKIGAMFSKFFGTRRMSKVVRETRELMKFRGISDDQDEEVCRGYESRFKDRSRRRQSTYNDIIVSEHMSRMRNGSRPVMDFRFVGLEKEEIDGPALLIDGTALEWSGCGDNADYGCHDNNTLKEVIVLIKGDAGCLMRGYAKLENIGSTVIRYSWLKVAENKPLPVPRPRRRFFYFLDDEGVVLPRETVYVPMLFRSKIPGYFTESWLLCTQPQLEGGAKVKFTFKAIARYEPDLCKEFQEIEDYLRKNEAQSVCSLQVKSIVDYATLKASLAEIPMTCHTVEESMEHIFTRRNPGLYFYGHIVKRLQLLCETYIAPNHLERLENGDIIVCVTDLWKTFCDLPDDDDDDTDDVSDDASDESKDESYTNLTRKQTLLWELYQDYYKLSFQPVLVQETSFHSRYVMMYTMLQTGIDKVVSYAHNLADILGLAAKKETKENDTVQKQEKGSSKGKGTSRGSKGGKKSQSPAQMMSPAPTVPQEVQQEVLEFSAAHKFRTDNTDQCNPKLAKYDEKVYIEMYSMLTNTIEEMSVLFENM